MVQSERVFNKVSSTHTRHLVRSSRNLIDLCRRDLKDGLPSSYLLKVSTLKYLRFDDSYFTHFRLSTVSEG